MKSLKLSIERVNMIKKPTHLRIGFNWIFRFPTVYAVALSGALNIEINLSVMTFCNSLLNLLC